MDLHRRFYDFVRGGEVFWLRNQQAASHVNPSKETSTGNSGNLGFPHQHIGGSCNFFNDLHMAPDSAAF